MRIVIAMVVGVVRGVLGGCVVPHRVVSGEWLPECDDDGYRCEGDCDPDVPCKWCNGR